MSPAHPNFSKNLFINCPFDKEYKSFLRVLIFTVIDCGFEPRISLERSDSGEVRISKIKKIIGESQLSIHDISRIEPLKKTDLPHFNMPFELGLDLGSRDFGSEPLKEKKCLILEKKKYRYQKVLSDISGNDIRAHNSDPETLIRQVRNWLYETARTKMPSATKIWQRFNEFYGNFEIITKTLNFSKKDIEEMPCIEFIEYIKEWKMNNPELS